MSTRTRYVIAIYEINRVSGGPEEGGWWYETGSLNRMVAVFRDPDRADACAMRANRLLTTLQRHKRSVSSMAYTGGRHAALVFEDTAPRGFPDARPRYE